MSDAADLILNARYFINPETFDVHENQQLTIRDGRIIGLTSIVSGVSNDDVSDYGDAVVLPAFVNTHTHLDLSHLRGLPLSGDDFGQWLAAVVRSRSESVTTICNAVEVTVNEMLGTGTAAVMDILATNQGALDVARVILNSGLRSCIAVEVLAMDPDAEMESLQQTLGLATMVQDAMLEITDEDIAYLNDRLLDGDRLPQVAISPHAPYSVSPKLFGIIAEYCQRQMLLQTTHLSESMAEREFIVSHSGELHGLYQAIGCNTDKMRWGTGTPVETWRDATTGRIIRGVNDCIVVHCYDLTDAEVAILGEMRATVAYCPRSRAFFGHPEFRFQDLIDAGAMVTLGTDSLGSNQNLDLLQELRQARREQPNVDIRELFRAATVNGRKAIQLRPSLHEGAHRLADLQVIDAPQGATPEKLLEQLIEQRPRQIATIVGGRFKYHAAL